MNRKSPTFTVLIRRYRAQLERLATTSPAEGETDVSPQARAMLLLSDGQTPQAAATATGLPPGRLEHFRRRFICLGPPGLVDAPALKRRPGHRFLGRAPLRAA